MNARAGFLVAAVAAILVVPAPAGAADSVDSDSSTIAELEAAGLERPAATVAETAPAPPIKGRPLVEATLIVQDGDTPAGAPESVTGNRSMAPVELMSFRID